MHRRDCGRGSGGIFEGNWDGWKLRKDLISKPTLDVLLEVSKRVGSVGYDPNIPCLQVGQTIHLVTSNGTSKYQVPESYETPEFENSRDFWGFQNVGAQVLSQDKVLAAS